MEKEEGEMSDDNMLVDDDESPQVTAQSNEIHTLTYQADKNGFLIQKLEKVDATKLEERARRFGLNLSGNKVVTQRQIDELYANFGIESGNERHFRFDSLHLNGVDGLSARDIFEYLEDFKPVSLEWIDDVSCNIVCQDHISAALALLVHSREIKREDLKEMLAVKSEHHWREGIPHPKKDLILMRFATNGDQKMTKKKPDLKQSYDAYDETMEGVSKNPWGDLCKSWGVYDHQEVFRAKMPLSGEDDDDDEGNMSQEIVKIKNKKLALRLGKRSYKYDEAEDSNSDSEWKMKSKTPRMRMHADDEENKTKKRLSPNLSGEASNDFDAYAPLSVEVANIRSNYNPRVTNKLSDKFKTQETKSIEKPRIKSRLGLKVAPSEDVWSSGESSADSTDHVMSRVHKISSRTKQSSVSTVWSRLEPKNTESEELQSDLRHILKSKRQNNSDDLRKKLRKSKQSNLRIEIDNNYARS